jgi:hypothetical protein
MTISVRLLPNNSQVSDMILKIFFIGMTTKFDIGFGKVMKKHDDTFVLNYDHNFKRF